MVFRLFCRILLFLGCLGHLDHTTCFLSDREKLRDLNCSTGRQVLDLLQPIGDWLMYSIDNNKILLYFFNDGGIVVVVVVVVVRCVVSRLITGESLSSNFRTLNQN